MRSAVRTRSSGCADRSWAVANAARPPTACRPGLPPPRTAGIRTVTWFIAIVVPLVLAGCGIFFLSRYYRKATRESALVRTGLGGQRVVLDGGCIALPFLHEVVEINMRTSRLEVERIGPRSVITRDRLRVDVGAEFHVRVAATDEGVATAAQALAGKTFRVSDLAEILEGKLVDATLSVAAGYTMESLQDARAKLHRRSERDAGRRPGPERPSARVGIAYPAGPDPVSRAG